MVSKPYRLRPSIHPATCNGWNDARCHPCRSSTLLTMEYTENFQSGGETAVMSRDTPMYKAFLWGFPALSIIATWWIPAAVQLSFFTTGLVSAIQTMAFRNEKIRKYLGIAPMPKTQSKDGEDGSGSGTLRLRNDQYSVEGQTGEREPAPNTYKSFFLNRQRAAPKGMDIDKYEQAKAAFAGGQWLQAKQFYREAVKDIKYTRLPTKSISSVAGKSAEVNPPKPKAAWREKLEKQMSDTTKPMTSYLKDRKDDVAAKERRDAIERFESKRRKEELLKRHADRRMRRERNKEPKL